MNAFPVGLKDGGRSIEPRLIQDPEAENEPLLPFFKCEGTFSRSPQQFIRLIFKVVGMVCEGGLLFSDIYTELMSVGLIFLHYFTTSNAGCLQLGPVTMLSLITIAIL